MSIPPEIPAFHQPSADAARAWQGRLTKPEGSLGRLEELAIWYAGVRARFPVDVPAHGELFVFAADHGVASEGVSRFPAAVTAAMVENFRTGGAAVSVLARQAGIARTVVDVGVAAPPFDLRQVGPGGMQFRDARVRAGTGNLCREPAMSRAELEAAVQVGRSCATAASDRGAEILLGGDMGIGNTTAAAALVCAFGGDDPSEIVGRGTGVDDATWVHKVAVVRSALAFHRPRREDPMGVLQALGGLEIAALAGMMMEGARHRIPTIVDGFIAGAAALAALRMAPGLRPFLLLSHLSAEAGARTLCAHLGGEPPLLDLGMRLGEGTGAVLALSIVRGAIAAQREMATFEAAAVPSSVR